MKWLSRARQTLSMDQDTLASRRLRSADRTDDSPRDGPRRGAALMCSACQTQLSETERIDHLGLWAHLPASQRPLPFCDACLEIWWNAQEPLLGRVDIPGDLGRR